MYEICVTKTPLISLCTFSNRSAAVNYVGTLVHSMAVWCLLHYLLLYYEAVETSIPVIVGFTVFPKILILAPASILVGVAVVITSRSC